MKYALLALSLLTIVACKKNYEPVVERSHISYKIDGQLHDIQGKGGMFSQQGVETYTTRSGENKRIVIDSYNRPGTGGYDDVTFTIDTDDPELFKRYTLYIQSGSSYYKAGEDYYYADTAKSSLVFTYADDNKIEGLFTFTGLTKDSTSITLTDGSFSILKDK